MVKKILVTGGAGFLGTHLCKYLLNQGNKVICIDNLHTGKQSNVQLLRSNPRFKFIHQDIIYPIQINQNMESIDEIYNLACPASPVHYKNDPLKTIKTNTQGVVNILELARDFDCKILQASTSEIYGDPDVTPQSENYLGKTNTFGSRACYVEGKRCAETLFYEYHKQYNIPIQIARIFNTYGPLMSLNDGRVISNFIVNSLRNSPITIYGDGHQTRSFCFVDDTINGLVKLMNIKNTFQSSVNIGRSVETTIGSLADLIIQITNSKSIIKYEPSTHDDPKKRKPDITLAKTLLEWEPKIDLIEGLKRTVNYFHLLLIYKNYGNLDKVF